MTHPSSPPAPMTAERLYEVREQYRSGRWGDGLPRELFGHIDALTARVAALERDNADVLKLGDEFGFVDRPFSVSQVLTHARYLQGERARLLFEGITLKSELAAARKVEDGEVADWIDDLRRPLSKEGWGPALQYGDGFEQLDRVRAKSADLLTRLSAALKEAKRESVTLAAGQCVIAKGGLTNDDYGNQFCAMERRAQAAEAKLYAAMDALTFILPLAKGYAHEHPVGANQRHVDEAAETLRALQTKDTTK